MAVSPFVQTQTPNLMRILQFNGPWNMSLESIPEPKPSSDEVLVRSEAVGICGSDVHGYTGESGRRKPGMVMGHEVAGTITAIGSSVDTLHVGQRVAIFPLVGCGKCVFCMNGSEQICPDKRILGVNGGKWGAMADSFVCYAPQAFEIDSKMDPAIGLFAEPISVAFHAVGRLTNDRKDPVAIVGAGTIGLALVLVLKHLGYDKVAILDKIPEKLALAKSLGATPIRADVQDAAEELTKLTGNGRVPIVFEAVGAADTVRKAYELCDLGGTLVLVGNLAKEFTLPLQGVTSNETTIRGSYGFTKSDFKKAVEVIPKYQGFLTQLISGSCSLEETPKIIGQLARNEIQATKFVIRPHGAPSQVNASAS
jgi:L-iditol 2-dehydrogenase